jgi:hypothetical protein
MMREGTSHLRLLKSTLFPQLSPSSTFPTQHLFPATLLLGPWIHSWLAFVQCDCTVALFTFTSYSHVRPTTMGAFPIIFILWWLTAPSSALPSESADISSLQNGIEIMNRVTDPYNVLNVARCGGSQGSCTTSLSGPCCSEFVSAISLSF